MRGWGSRVWRRSRDRHTGKAIAGSSNPFSGAGQASERARASRARDARDARHARAGRAGCALWLRAERDASCRAAPAAPTAQSSEAPATAVGPALVGARRGQQPVREVGDLEPHAQHRDLQAAVAASARRL